MESIEGHARIWLANPEGSRTKFSFLLHLPDQGSIEVSNFLGHSLYRILVSSDEAYLIIPSKKVYWKGDETEIFDRFLGFPLDLNEMISLISGEWTDLFQEKLRASAWRLEKDAQGRVIAGQREALRFSVEDFILDSRFPRSLRFEHPGNSGRLKILKMDFNRPHSRDAFVTGFIREYASKTWEEIQDILNDEG
jgi:outer membrane biogenesis lipoprotein LolB